MSVDFLFQRRLDNGHPVDFVFGESGAEDNAAVVSFAIALAVVPDIRVLSFVREDVSFAVGLELTVAIHAIYDNAVSSVTQSSVRSGWQEGARRRVDRAGLWQENLPLRRSASVPWGEGSPMPVDRTAPWKENTRVPRTANVPWQQATALRGLDAGGAWQERTRSRSAHRASWQEGTRAAPRTVRTHWQERSREARADWMGRWHEGSGASATTVHPWGEATLVQIHRLLPWQESMKPNPGKSVIKPPEPPVVDPCDRPPVGDAVHFVFKERWDGRTDFLFACDHDDVTPPAQIVVPVKRVYIVMNETSLWRVDGAVPIPAYSMSLSIDVDSWTWSFSASVPGAALGSLEPSAAGEPVELEARINGRAYRFIAEGLTRERTFGQARLNVRGRGKSALLDSPYAPTLNFSSAEDRTAEQLMNDVLTDNGVAIGWELDWQLEDWLVPGGVWASQGAYIKALSEIAAASGGYLLPHHSAQSFKVLHRYPHAPWDWATEVTPDFELPSAVTQREGIEWVEKARYNRVFVAGQAGGILGQVTRTGTAGDVIAPMVTDALVTAAAAARQRGRAILSDTGRIATVALRLPVLEATNIIEPGRFVRYVDGDVARLGIVRSTSVEVNMPEVWQTIGVETHVG